MRLRTWARLVFTDGSVVCFHEADSATDEDEDESDDDDCVVYRHIDDDDGYGDPCA